MTGRDSETRDAVFEFMSVQWQRCLGLSLLLWGAGFAFAGAPGGPPSVANARQTNDRSVVTERDREFWSFQPLQFGVLPSGGPGGGPPQGRSSKWARSPIDQFILEKLNAKGLKPNPPVDKRKLIRRAYFDLIGLPPTPQEINDFLNDKSPDAYEKLIDRLLASPHYGERWGRHWLDLARFGESHGYEQDYDRPFAYHYRDFVIRALNNDLPYDQFVKWQIAGDELEPDNPQAWFATGFLGAGTHATQITVNQAEKERYDELDDQISTIGTALLGLTLGCARCHDHKFDPIPTQDYYRLLSTFTTTVRSEYDVDLNPAQSRAALAAWERAHQPLVAARQKFENEKLPPRLDAWLKTNPRLPQPEWLWLDLAGFKVSGGYYGKNTTTAEPDGSRLVAIIAGAPDTMSFTAKTTVSNIAAIRLEALADKSLPDRGPGWAKDGGFKLADFKVTATPLQGDTNAVTLKFARRRATTDKDSTNAPLPWTDGGQKGRDHAAVFELEKPATFAGGAEFSFTLKFPADFDRNVLGRVRVSVSRNPGASLDAPPVALKDFEKAQEAFVKLESTGVRPAVSGASPGTSSSAEVETANSQALPKAERDALLKLYRTIDPDWRNLNAAVIAHAKAEPRPQLVKAQVCSENLPALRLHTQGPDFYEKTYLLKRGDPAQKQSEATPSFLQVLMRAPEQEKRWQVEPSRQDGNARTPLRRTAFANWITDADGGAGALLARVMVNRLWQHHFGQGLVATPSDFGSQGVRPSHPELLEWLAAELIRNGWHLKPLHKAIMMSAVYMQGTQTDDTRMKIDPENTLLWHRSRQRLEGEIIRDAILAVSGRLDLTMFGPGSLDEQMQRRSIYFTIKRSKLIPTMVQFDAPDSLQGLGRRVNTTVAPQALLLMNNPQVRAAAADCAKRLRLKAEKSLNDAVSQAYELALGRPPLKTELKDSVAFIGQQRASYEKENALDLALEDFCQTVFCLNEFVYVE